MVTCPGRRALPSGLIALALLGLAGCEPKVVGYHLRVVTRTCGEASPLDGVTHFQFRVTGPGITRKLERVTPVGLGVQEVPEIPAGEARTVEVRGYQGPPPGGRLVSVGRTLPFEVPRAVPLPVRDIELTVFLRRVNSFQRTALSVSPTTCGAMLAARAGHTASVLSDGRVLLAGGAQLGPGGLRTLPARTELYNPSTGAFEEGPLFEARAPDGTPTPLGRAFHTASTLLDGRILFAGGESYEGRNVTALRSGGVFDPATREIGSVTLAVARTRHVAESDNLGRVLIVGGVTSAGAPVPEAEWFDPQRAVSTRLAAAVPRVGARALALQGRRRIAVVGGSNGTVMQRQLLFFEFVGGTFGAVTTTAALLEPRRTPGVAALANDQQLLVAGGFNTPTDNENTAAIASSELVSSSAMQVTEGPAASPRGDVCAVTLPDGRVLSVGGRSGSFGFLFSDGSAELVSAAGGGAPVVLGMPSLARSRYHHTCTVLGDGTVLVAGGNHEEGGVAETLQDAYVFTPAPLE